MHVHFDYLRAFQCVMTSSVLWPTGTNQMSGAWSAAICWAVSLQWKILLFFVLSFFPSKSPSECTSRCRTSLRFFSAGAGCVCASSSCTRCPCAQLAAETYLTAYRGEMLKSVCRSSRTIHRSSRKKVKSRRMLYMYICVYVYVYVYTTTGQCCFSISKLLWNYPLLSKTPTEAC